MDNLRGTIWQYHVRSCGTNYSAEDNQGGTLFFVVVAVPFFFGWGNAYSTTGQPLFNHFYFHIPLGNWFLCDVMASNRIPIFTVNWSSRVALKVHVTYRESVGGDELGQDHF